MKSRKRLFIVVAAEFLIIMLLAFYVFTGYIERQYTKELFINKSYFLLKDVSEGIEAESYDDVVLNLVKLDTIFEMFRQETKGNFYYGDPGFWGVFADSIRSKQSNSDDLILLADGIRDVIHNLSDNSGIAENPKLSYKELNDIFDLIF